MSAHQYDSDWDHAEDYGDDSHAVAERAEELLEDLAALIEQAPGESSRPFIAALDALMAKEVSADYAVRQIDKALRQMADALARQQLRAAADNDYEEGAETL